MIVIDNCNKKFEKLNVLKNVSITLESGQCVALIGPNGCGKTTLIKSILGMVIPDSGAIFVKNQSIQKDFLYRNNIGYMPQIGRYPEGLTIGEVIEMIKELRNSKDKLDEELLHSFEVQKMFDKPMGTLSGGTTQKVSAVLAFLFNPDILILDEPTAGLDPLAAEVLKTKINKEKAKGKLIMITSHLLSELDDLITHIIFMQEGEIQFYKTINELKSQTAEEKISKAIAKILKQKLFTN
ncbi:ABC transporter ATP-binding protein [Flavobacterium columnare]|uniref:ABC transporter ATP-binding protein n=1 Tax=Flavobacterium columnare TaxID=996 RepID=A0AAI8CJB5_9FLAO|nr:ABC transporter ATP-binding protein [Flavobacterium columnare]AMO21299.1 ABC transporter ATP-binding protein [Flavobacterium columnare]AUX19323.1 copper ABC transporter ATP-binding protein [Flavobacterium columnare]MEB3799597.1 ABC transporter ATP-binding protein [Flavobacterium columnare]QOG58410.1 ABC transporter ATP-binding protein [Flavobacterium columnare]QOG61133.1 ABC transporter ATP-binding protein [Flavobacterium columnare]